MLALKFLKISHLAHQDTSGIQLISMISMKPTGPTYFDQFCEAYWLIWLLHHFHSFSQKNPATMIPTFPVDKPHSLELLPHAAPPRKWWNNKGKLTLRSSVFSFSWLVVRTSKNLGSDKIEESAAKGLFCHNGLLFSQQFLQTCILRHVAA